ncbi:autotransporter outer membrane beta-barrel domain-containing protein, partial [Salmonella enterica]|nr:autotransporter outer membrane beta-barrel domain-containing protein [Salmonella enterica]
NKSREFQPFVEANWIHNTQPASVKMDDVSSDMRGTKNIGELKVGIEGQITPRLNVWGNVAQQIGDQGYSNTQGLLGVKYSF